MTLTDKQTPQFKDEPSLSSEIPQRMATPEPKQSVSGKLESFFETKLGFWILTTVLAGVVSVGFTRLQTYMAREELAKAAAAEASRRDIDTIIKLAPMLLSSKRSESTMGIALLSNLSSKNGVSDEVATKVTAIFDDAIAEGSRERASPEEQQLASDLLKKVDSAGLHAMSQALATGAAPLSGEPAPSVPSAIQEISKLPIRVYIQVAKLSPDAEKLKEALRRDGIVVPDIEVIKGGIAPPTNLRYCQTKVDPTAVQRVQASLQEVLNPAPTPLILNSNLCGKVRMNHFELWIAASQ